MSEKKTKRPRRTKKPAEPQYVNSLLNTPVLNYKVYRMKKRELLLYTISAFAAGAALALLMYSGIGKDESGSPTVLTYFLDAVIACAVGCVTVRLFIPVMCEILRDRRLNVLRRQFMDLLDALAASVASGNNAVKSFEAAKTDLMLQYGEDSYIVDELTLMIKGQQNFIDIDKMLTDFGSRSGIREVESFAQVFAISYRKGGDFGKVIRDSYDILYNKLSIEMEIQTKIAATKNELNIMLVMPFVMVGFMKYSSPDFAANFATPSGVLGITAGLVLTAGAYLVGRKITDIKV